MPGAGDDRHRAVFRGKAMSKPICAPAQALPRKPQLITDEWPELPPGCEIVAVSCRYPSELEIARELMGPKTTLATWRAMVPILEAQGLPPINPLFGGRPWPKVCAWLDKYDGVREVQAPVSTDGPGDWS
jgi:hypothetical protein